MVIIKKRKGDNKDNIFRRFAAASIGEEIVTLLRERQYYKRPALIRQEKQKGRRTQKRSRA